MASTTTLEKMYELSEGHSWLQLYIFQDEAFVMELLDRAEKTGYEVAILTVDVPVLSRRTRDDKNGFSYPFKIGPKQFFDFATHPVWSISTLLNGIPKPMNYETSKSGKGIFKRKESRGKTDWETLKRVRNKWKGKLIVKGVMSSDDAVKIKEMGADGASGLRRIVDIIKEETSTTLGLVGLNDINEVSSDIIEQKLFMNTTY